MPLKIYKRELRIIKSLLKVGLKRDISDSKNAKYLLQKGYITKSGRTSKKGKIALRLL